MSSENTMSLENPFNVFKHWFEKAQQHAHVKYPDAMNLATVSAAGQPSNRTVLLKHWDEAGFVFYTNLTSRKGGEISANGKVSVCFHWDAMDVQIRIEGVCAQVDDAQADIYFDSRPMQSRVGAWASKQSQPLASHAHLLKRVAKQSLKLPLGKMHRPDFWSGFRIVPHRIEFMQMKDYRLHERREFKLIDGHWVNGLLYP
ncbi:MAG: pyridoxamine 5'-phosphate oxidase [Rhizobiales bacterium]|nr:pyridoxamine 5'-phosphate oxidase [Hyphomicrobiales bacterium]NRB15682.1 pyridoxamine 5'-phosphate oxidase [Hyphomicrobiales bacterium]